jgi:hypothetical protein
MKISARDAMQASYEASTLGKRGYYNSAALDIFGNAALDPYSFHA